MEKKEGADEGKEIVDELLNWAALAIIATDEDHDIIIGEIRDEELSTRGDLLESADLDQEQQLAERDLSLEPVDLFALDDEHYLDPFTEEELVSVLRSFDDDKKAGEILELPAAGDVLPDLDLDLDERDDSLLLPPEELSAIFNRDNDFASRGSDRDDASSTTLRPVEPLQVDDTEDFFHEIEERQQGYVLDNSNIATEEDEDDLLEGIKNLNLNWQPTDSQDNDDLPPYFYCQPCTPTLATAESSIFTLAPISEDEAVTDQSAWIGWNRGKEEHRKLPQQEFDTLLQLSLLNIDDGENPLLSEGEMDFPFEENNQHYDGHAAAAAAAVERTDHPHRHHDDQQAGQGHHSVHHNNFSYHPATLQEAETMLQSFVVGPSGLKNERSCLGHKETIFGTSFSECGKYLATASQDSTIKIWNVEKNTPLTTLTEHRKDYECLRVAWASSTWAKDIIDRGSDRSCSFLLATAGADGIVKVWSCRNPSESNSTWTCCATIDHGSLSRKPSKPDDDQDTPQVYALEFINHWKGLPIADEKSSQNSFLLTSSNDFVHLWEIEPNCEQSNELHLREVMSLQFSSMLQDYGYGVSVTQVTSAGLTVDSSSEQQEGATKACPSSNAFGGDRNPSNLNFVFDASYNPANGLLGVALSDGSLRIMNGRGICLSILQLPGCQSHLTSFCWDSTGTRLATSVATGHVIIWRLDVGDGKGGVTASCAAVLEGGHQVGRPVFGSRFCGSAEDLLVTWGVDGRICLWDGFSQGNIEAPRTILVNNPSYPIYAVAVSASCFAVGGGGGEASFLGVPVMLYDILKHKPPNRNDN